MSTGKRWLIAFGLAVALGWGFTALISYRNEKEEQQQKAVDPFAVWKARTGVDLATLPKLRPQRENNEAALALDVILKPTRLKLRGQDPEETPPAKADDLEPTQAEEATFDELRRSLRGAIRATELTPALSTDI